MKNRVSLAGRDWFGLLSLPCKIFVISAMPATLMYYRLVSVPGLPAATVNSEMKGLVHPIQIACMFTGACLAGIATLEFSRRRFKKGAWNLAFAMLALFCWQFAQSFGVPVL